MSLMGVKLLILCEDRELFELTEGYLAHKGVNTHICRSVEKFVAEVKSFNPDYAIISVDHSDVYARKLLGVFMGSGVNCIPTADVNTEETNKLLDEINVEHVLYPPVNGNRVEYLIKHLESERKKKLADEADSVDYADATDSSPGDSIHYGDITERIDELMQGYQAESSSTEPSEIDLLEEQLQSEYGFTLKPKAEVVIEKPVEKKAEKDELATALPEGLMGDVWHLFDECMHSFEGCNSIDHPEHLTSVSSFIVYSVKGGDISGYAFAVIEDFDAKSGEDFVGLETKFLQGVTDSIDGDVDLQKLELTFEPFDFNSWVQNESGVMQSFEYQGVVLTWGFIERPEMDLVVAATGDDDMVSVELDDLNPDVKARTDFYLHLPKNDKYILYTKKGNTVLSNQINRLQEREVQDLHIKKEEINQLKDYKVEKDITEMIKKQKAS